MNHYEKLIAWQVAHEVALEIYDVTKNFPKEELYGLASQLRRSASSIATNIAEGRSRRHNKEYIHFLNIARGSTGETHYQLRLARDLGYIEESKYQALKEKVERTGRLLSGLISSIKRGRTHR